MEEHSESVVQATQDLHEAKQTWEQMQARLVELEAKGIHTSDAEEDELLRLERRLEAYPEHLDNLQQALEMAFDTGAIDQVTAAAPARVAALVDDHHDFQRWLQDGIALVQRWRAHRLALEQLLAQLPRELHEIVQIGTVEEVIQNLPPLLRALMADGAGWLIESTFAADKGTQDLPSNLYERYRDVIDLRLRREASMRAQAEAEGAQWITVYESRTGRPVPMRPTDAQEALSIGHHQAQPPQWATAREDER